MSKKVGKITKSNLKKTKEFVTVIRSKVLLHYIKIHTISLKYFCMEWKKTQSLFIIITQFTIHLNYVVVMQFVCPCYLYYVY